MAFKLEVRFSGLCLYVMHPTRDDAAVLLPDARLNGSLQGAGAKHLDGTPGSPSRRLHEYRSRPPRLLAAEAAHV
jgi:hypothetical protein